MPDKNRTSRESCTGYPVLARFYLYFEFLTSILMGFLAVSGAYGITIWGWRLSRTVLVPSEVAHA
jgi:hypothetical protein